MNEFLTLSEIGKVYGVSSHQVGKWLKGLQLRTEAGQPSQTAFNGGYVRQAPSTQPGTYFYVWNAAKTAALLDGMCYPRAVPDPVERQHRSGDS